MSPELHERAVEIFETTTGVEYSAHVENTPEWDDAVAKADDTTADTATTITITFTSSIPANLQDRVEAFAADLRTISGIDQVAVIPIRTCTGCGCTDEQACFGGCWWIGDDQDLCSRCVPAAADAAGEER